MNRIQTAMLCILVVLSALGIFWVSRGDDRAPGDAGVTRDPTSIDRVTDEGLRESGTESPPVMRSPASGQRIIQLVGSRDATSSQPEVLLRLHDSGRLVGVRIPPSGDWVGSLPGTECAVQAVRWVHGRFGATLSERPVVLSEQNPRVEIGVHEKASWAVRLVDAWTGAPIRGPASITCNGHNLEWIATDGIAHVPASGVKSIVDISAHGYLPEQVLRLPVHGDIMVRMRPFGQILVVKHDESLVSVLSLDGRGIVAEERADQHQTMTIPTGAGDYRVVVSSDAGVRWEDVRVGRGQSVTVRGTPTGTFRQMSFRITGVDLRSTLEQAQVRLFGRAGPEDGASVGSAWRHHWFPVHVIGWDRIRELERDRHYEWEHSLRPGEYLAVLTQLGLSQRFIVTAQGPSVVAFDSYDYIDATVDLSHWPESSWPIHVKWALEEQIARGDVIRPAVAVLAGPTESGSVIRLRNATSRVWAIGTDGSASESVLIDSSNLASRVVVRPRESAPSLLVELLAADGSRYLGGPPRFSLSPIDVDGRLTGFTDRPGHDSFASHRLFASRAGRYRLEVSVDGITISAGVVDLGDAEETVYVTIDES